MSMASLVQQADAVADAVTAYLETLAPAEWTQPSDCAGWTVADLVAHLVLVEQLLGSSIARGLQGDSGPPPHAAGGREAWLAYRSGEIARLGALPTTELLAAYRDGLGPLRTAFASAQTNQDDAAQGWHPSAGARPIVWFPGQWLVEITLHDWDLRVAADPAAEVNPAAQPALGPEMRARMPWCYKPRQPEGLSGTVRIDLPGSTAWLARLADGSIDTLDDGAAQSDATIRTDAGSYALVQTARRPVTLLNERGRWQTSGDTALADQLAEAFGGY